MTTGADLHARFEEIGNADVASAGNCYRVLPTGSTNYLVGKDSDASACFLIAVGPSAVRDPAIRLESLHVQFDLHCTVQSGNERSEGTFIVLRYAGTDSESVRYFFGLCALLQRTLGHKAEREAAGSGIRRLVNIFMSLQNAPLRSAQGLFGELLLIRRSRSAVFAVNAWRLDENARFDFVAGKARVDVKTSTGRVRAHSFSYEQCSPPDGSTAVVASMLLEIAPTGATLGGLIDEVDARVAHDLNASTKLREVVAATLGSGLKAALQLRFDRHLAESTMSFYSLRDIPAIRTSIPVGVSAIRFRSDLSGVAAIPVEALVHDPDLRELLPDVSF